jgi:hypothetical protein
MAGMVGIGDMEDIGSAPVLPEPVLAFEGDIDIIMSMGSIPSARP